MRPRTFVASPMPLNALQLLGLALAPTKPLRRLLRMIRPKAQMIFSFA
jgi:hypothetical protein